MSCPSEYLHLQQPAILAADAHGFHAQFLNHCDQVFVHFVQNHLRDFHGLAVCDAQAVYEGGFLAYFPHPAADFLAAAVDDDGLEAYQF